MMEADDSSSAAVVVVQSQLEHLDDTDIYATAWSDAIQCARENGTTTSSAYGKPILQWGGRGQGGRGMARRTFQPTDIVLPSVRLEYVGQSVAAKDARLLLENAVIKLLSGHVYALVGPNGCGKSSLLRRMEAGRIPGFPPHVSTLYLAQQEDDDVDIHNEDNNLTAMEWVLQRYQAYCSGTVQVAGRAHIDDLEAAIEDLDVSDPESAQCMEEIAEQISQLENELAENETASDTQKKAEEALAFTGIDSTTSHLLLKELTKGQRKKVTLAMALLACLSASCDLLLLDEPTNSLDVPGLLQLRQVVESITASPTTTTTSRRPTTVLLVSHDCDFINDVATDIIEFNNCTLKYYSGNYTDYLIQRQQLERHQERQATCLGKKHEAMKQALDNLKKQPVPKRGGTKKKARTITSHKKKIERLLGDAENVAVLSTNGRRKKFDDVPDKSIQFHFRNCSSKWNEPLISALNVGHKYKPKSIGGDRSCTSSDLPQMSQAKSDAQTFPLIVKKDDFLFDCVDLCIQEGGIYCIMGENASGKSTLLKILAKLLPPIEGKVVHALNVNVAFLDQSHVHNFLDCKSGATALLYLMEKFPNKSEQEIRGELTAFGLSSKQAGTNVRFLSGGERCRLCLVDVMLQSNPEVLCLNHPTANLDVESVEALIYGLEHWNGTTIVVSHDAHFLRSLEAQCYVLIAEEGKLRRVEGGVDAYLRSFGTRRQSR